MPKTETIQLRLSVSSSSPGYEKKAVKAAASTCGRTVILFRMVLDGDKTPIFQARYV
jgi:hypothetical protein